MASSARQRRQVTYSGTVQGVGFRYTTCRLAQGHPVVGYVRNLADGRVEMVVEGTPEALDRWMLALAEQMGGLISSYDISSYDCDRQPALGEFAEFSIRY
jgi:acylphosphatase